MYDGRNSELFSPLDAMIVGCIVTVPSVGGILGPMLGSLARLPVGPMSVQVLTTRSDRLL